MNDMRSNMENISFFDENEKEVNCKVCRWMMYAVSVIWVMLILNFVGIFEFSKDIRD